MAEARRQAGALLRQARQQARLSQADLGRAAGVSQSVISAYESGKRQPALPTLARLIEAAGLQLDLQVRRPRTGLGRLTGPRGRVVRRRRADLLEAARRHGVSNVRVFGSVARGQDGPDSDVDLLVDLPDCVGLLGLARLQADFEAVLDARVDLVPADALRPRVRNDVLAEAIAL